MVWMRALQGRNMGMRHRIIPPQLLVVEINFVGILEDTRLKEIDLLKDTQRMSRMKGNLTAHDANRLPMV